MKDSRLICYLLTPSDKSFIHHAEEQVQAQSLS